MDDSEALALYRACAFGTRSEQVAAFERLGRLLYEIAWRRVRDDPRLEHLAEDCMQEALVTIWRRLQAGQGPDRPASFIHWAATIVLNKLREEIRRLDPATAVRPAKRVALRLQTSLDAPETPEGLPLVETLPDRGAGPEELLQRQELIRLLDEIRTTTAISEPSRIVLLKGYIEGWEDAELAEFLATTTANVHVIRCRDLAKLRRQPEFMRRLQDLAE